MPATSKANAAKKKRIIQQLKDSGLVTVDEFAVLIHVGMPSVAAWWNGGPVGVAIDRLERAAELVRQKGIPNDKLILRDDPPADPVLSRFAPGLLDRKLDARIAIALGDLEKRVARIVDERLSVLLGLNS